MLNISGDLVSPTIVEHDASSCWEHRSSPIPHRLVQSLPLRCDMTREIARCRRYSVPLSLLLVDVDRLKLMNDRWAIMRATRRWAASPSRFRRACAARHRGAAGRRRIRHHPAGHDAVAGLIVATRIRRHLIEARRPWSPSAAAWSS